MSKEEIFEELKAIRDLRYVEIEVYEALQELIWKIGEDIGEF